MRPTGRRSRGTSSPGRVLSRALAPIAADPTTLLPRLAAALSGDGPALLPLPGGPAARAVVTAMQPDAPLERDDVALVVPTSGSTGDPKGALLTASALRHSARATVERLGGAGQWLLALPVTHIAGLQVLVRSIVSDVPPVLLDLDDGFSVDAFAAATERLDPSLPRYTAVVPTQLRRLVDAGADLTSYDAILVGGAALTFPAPGNVVRTYGMSETCGGCVYDGLPLDGVDARIEPDGRVSLGGPVLFSGYRLRPDLTAEALVAGRHLTQDLGRWSAGRLVVLGRADDVIVTGGVNVPAAMVERALAGHPSVQSLAVIGVPDAEWGERVVAVVQSREPVTVAELRDFAGDRLESAALPRACVVVERLPMLPSGKPDRSALRSLVAADGTHDH
ncbi:MAG: o-succinylbenzoate--CoA ligase [Actinomycetes bacterium]